ncbi:MAG: hypothetical protein H0U03_04510 [Actinobacteria bacterium]|nr:hypothetical protein [Actinomycetota bacterium]
MRIIGHATTATCEVCGRSLLTGERSTRYSPNGGEFVEVCPLCQDVAVEHGWLKEGSPTTPMVPLQRQRRRLNLGGIFEARRPTTEAPVAPDPILRRLSQPELAIVEAADLFNASAFRRTVGGIAKSLGPANASLVPLSGVNTEMVATVAWDLSWYQYRITFDSAQPVRLAERGHELAELDESFKHWNAQVEKDGRLVPEITRV